MITKEVEREIEVELRVLITPSWWVVCLLSRSIPCLKSKHVTCFPFPLFSFLGSSAGLSRESPLRKLSVQFLCMRVLSLKAVIFSSTGILSKKPNFNTYYSARGGSLVYSAPFVRRVACSNPALAAA